MANDIRNYNMASKLLHWLSALVVLGLLVVGMVMEDMEGPEKYQLMDLHKSFGVVLLILLVIRVANRLMNPVDSLPGLSEVNVKLLKAGHGLLYLMMLMMPVSGVLMSQSGGHGVEVFGLALPMFTGESELLNDITHVMHGLGANLLILLIVGHIGAALYHQYILKDGTLTRMTRG